MLAIEDEATGRAPDFLGSLLEVPGDSGEPTEISFDWPWETRENTLIRINQVAVSSLISTRVFLALL